MKRIPSILAIIVGISFFLAYQAFQSRPKLEINGDDVRVEFRTLVHEKDLVDIHHRLWMEKSIKMDFSETSFYSTGYVKRLNIEVTTPDGTFGSLSVGNYPLIFHKHGFEINHSDHKLRIGTLK